MAFEARQGGVGLLISKQERLVPEDREHTSVISIELLMGERNKIEEAMCKELPGMAAFCFACFGFLIYSVSKVNVTNF